MLLPLMLAVMQAPADEDCNFMMSFDGPGNTTVMMVQSETSFTQGDVVSFAIFNENWSLNSGDKISERITIDSEAYSFWHDTPHAMKNGFLLRVDWKHINGFFDEFPSAVTVKKGKQVIDRLNFSGFYSDWLKFRSCRQKRVTAKAERDRQRAIESLPKDPFAPK